MASGLYSVDQVAEKLGLHPRTIRTYVRAGRLKATRIGKQYRIAQADLDQFIAGNVAAVAAPTLPTRRVDVDVSAAVRIDGIDAHTADRIATAVLASAHSRGGGGGLLRVEVVREPDRGRMRFVVLGTPDETADVLRMIGTLVEATS